MFKETFDGATNYDPETEINARKEAGDKTYEDGLLEGRTCRQSEIDYHIEKTKEKANREWEILNKINHDNSIKALEAEREKIKQNIGILRQYCNELPEGTLITNAQIEYILMGEK